MSVRTASLPHISETGISEVVGSGICLLVLSHGQPGVERGVNSISRKDRWLHYTLFMTTFNHTGGG